MLFMNSFTQRSSIYKTCSSLPKWVFRHRIFFSSPSSRSFGSPCKSGNSSLMRRSKYYFQIFQSFLTWAPRFCRYFPVLLCKTRLNPRTGAAGATNRQCCCKRSWRSIPPKGNPAGLRLVLIFSVKIPLFRRYAVYCSNQPFLVPKLRELKQRPDIAAFLNEAFCLPQCRLLELDRYGRKEKQNQSD